ncbi:MAG: response regulator transcription factor [Spirochaetales bacterium]|nr:response regulator transcription factor [Spirochaetales bacterium]
MEQRGVLYLRNKERTSLEGLAVYCELNNFSLIVHDEGDSSPLPTFSEDQVHILLVDYPVKSREHFKEIGKIKRSRSLPLVMIMEPGSESDQIDAFTDGADDIFFREDLNDNGLTLIRRLHNLVGLSQRSTVEPLQNWRIGEDLITLNIAGRMVQVNGRTVHLTPTEWNILRLLSDKNGLVVSRETILDRCFEYQYEGYDRSIDSHVKNLRKKIPQVIETKRGVGYRFVAEAEEREGILQHC